MINLILYPLLLSILSLNAFAKNIKTVDYVDPQKYLGTWYEIASIPQSFSKGCVCSRAQYGQKDNGDISVFNSCNKDTPKGELDYVKGSAYIADKSTNAKLKVTFFWPFYGDYWIIGLDNDYRYAVVSNSDGEYLWILSRTPQMEKFLFDEALEIAKVKGAKVDKLQMTDHSNCTYP